MLSSKNSTTNGNNWLNHKNKVLSAPSLASETRLCLVCGDHFSKAALPGHYKSCVRKYVGKPARLSPLSLDSLTKPSGTSKIFAKKQEPRKDSKVMVTGSQDSNLDSQGSHGYAVSHANQASTRPLVTKKIRSRQQSRDSTTEEYPVQTRQHRPARLSANSNSDENIESSPPLRRRRQSSNQNARSGREKVTQAVRERYATEESDHESEFPVNYKEENSRGSRHPAADSTRYRRESLEKAPHPRDGDEYLEEEFDQPAPPTARRPQQPPSPKRRSGQPPVETAPITSDPEEEYRPHEVLHPCLICKRKFADESRLEKHMVACSKTQKPRKVFDATKARVRGTELEKYVVTGKKKPAAPEAAASRPIPKKKSNWRQKHAEFQRMVREGRGEKNVAQAISQEIFAGEELPPANPDYVTCTHCERRFNQVAAERHIPICKESKRRTELRGTVSPAKKTESAAEARQRRMRYNARQASLSPKKQ